jgi:hypothetical protein
VSECRQEVFVQFSPINGWRLARWLAGLAGRETGLEGEISEFRGGPLRRGEGKKKQSILIFVGDSYTNFT